MSLKISVNYADFTSRNFEHLGVTFYAGREVLVAMLAEAISDVEFASAVEVFLPRNCGGEIISTMCARVFYGLLIFFGFQTLRANTTLGGFVACSDFRVNKRLLHLRDECGKHFFE